MPTGLLERLISRDRGRSQRGNIDWLTVLEDCLDDAETVSLLRQIPSAERRALLAETGREVYRRDLGNFAAELSYNTDFVIASGQLPDFGEQREDHAACLFAGLSDAVDFLTRASGEEHLAATRVDVQGLSHLQPFPQRRGVLLLSVFQSHIGYMAPLLETLGKVALIRKPQGSEGRDYFPQRLLEWRAALEVVPADAAGGMRLFQILRNRGVVGLYNDFLYPDARAVRGLLFGRHVPISRTLLLMIRKTGAVVIPTAIARRLPVEGNEVQVCFFPPLPASLAPEEATETALAIQLSLATECLIRRFPAQWRLWNTLRLRWERGEELP
ncbi:MAG TPA: hypothetical protein VIC28_18235 [Thermoanaerobaculia bacterium]